MRQNIRIKFSQPSYLKAPVGEIYIYSHWDGDRDVNTSPLAQKLRKALARRLRWGDESYLVRMIVSEVIKDDIEGETGYGIAPYIGEDEYPTIQLDLPAKRVNGMTFEDFINYKSDV